MDNIATTALKITSDGLLEPSTLGRADDGLWYNRTGQGFRVAPDTTTDLAGWGFGAGVALVSVQYPADGPRYWANPADVLAGDKDNTAENNG